VVGWVKGRDSANQVTRKSWVSFLNPAYTYGLFLDSLLVGWNTVLAQDSLIVLVRPNPKPHIAIL